MKKILIIKDPENEVGFHVLCDYCNVVQQRVGNDVVVLPMWNNGCVDLIDDKHDIELVTKQLKDVLEEYEIELKKEESNNKNKDS